MSNRRRLLQLAFLAFSFSFSGALQAAISFSLVPSTTNLGPNGGVVTITARILGNAGESITGFDLPIDISNVDLDTTNNVGGPVFVGNFTKLSPIPGNFFSGIAPVAGVPDFLVSDFDTNPAGVSTTGGIDLFRFNATFAPNTTLNDINFAFSYLLNDPQAGIALAGGGAPSITATGTTITVSAVPEPGTLALLSATALIALRRQRFRLRSLYSKI